MVGRVAIVSRITHCPREDSLAKSIRSWNWMNVVNAASREQEYTSSEGFTDIALKGSISKFISRTYGIKLCLKN